MATRRTHRDQGDHQGRDEGRRQGDQGECREVERREVDAAKSKAAPKATAASRAKDVQQVAAAAHAPRRRDGARRVLEGTEVVEARPRPPPSAAP